MLRVRLAAVVVAAGLGLTSGCASLCNLPFLNRHRALGPELECLESGVMSLGDGPVLGDGSVPPNGTLPFPRPVVTPEAGVPSLSPAPRLVPQPHAQPMPYTP